MCAAPQSHGANQSSGKLIYFKVGRFDLAALGGCHTLNVCYVMLCQGRPACLRMAILDALACKAILHACGAGLTSMYVIILM